jgi:hypothetical protein
MARIEQISDMTTPTMSGLSRATVSGGKGDSNVADVHRGERREHGGKTVEEKQSFDRIAG